MFDPGSRYYRTPTATLEIDGREVTYLRRRFLPPAEALTTLAEVAVTEGDRLDSIAARTLSNPEQFWRICDAEEAMNPTDLTSRPGRRLRVPIPGVEG